MVVKKPIQYSSFSALNRRLCERDALKYGEAATPVAISLSVENGDTARLSVSDQGPGIPAEHLPHLTRRFYRTDPGRSRAAGGTGLGLAIVKHIVERHRGKLDIESASGDGARFIVRLPLLAESAPGGA